MTITHCTEGRRRVNWNGAAVNAQPEAANKLDYIQSHGYSITLADGAGYVYRRGRLLVSGLESFDAAMEVAFALAQAEADRDAGGRS